MRMYMAYMRLLKVFFIGFSFCLLGGKASAQSTTEGVAWLSFEEAIARHKENPKKILIDLYTDWCGWCKVMDQKTYSQEDIATYINTHFYPIKFNGEQKEAVSFNGYTFEFVPSGRRGYHQLAAALTRNQLSYPTTVFLDEELRIIQPIPGYLKADQMEPIIIYIGEDHFKTTEWGAFKKSNKSSL